MSFDYYNVDPPETNWGDSPIEERVQEMMEDEIGEPDEKGDLRYCRLCDKDFPDDISDKELRKHFEKHAMDEATDDCTYCPEADDDDEEEESFAEYCDAEDVSNDVENA